MIKDFIFKRLFSEESGNALLFFTLSFIVVLGIAGVAIDGGSIYSARSQLKKAANAAALSGAQELFNGTDSITKVVNKILDEHGEKSSLKSMTISVDGEKKLKVELERNVPTYFMKIFKVKDVKVYASSTSRLSSMSRAKGAVPLGIDESIQLKYLQDYKLKVDSGYSSSGIFGILALSGTGSKLYEQDLRTGFSGELKVGEVINTETGNVEGKTKDAINSRIAACPYGAGDYQHRDCPRIILIPIYKPYTIDSNQLKQVKITGFAYFYIKEPMNSNDSSISGYFIKRSGNGYGDDTVVDRGAYAIKLIE